MHSLKRKKKKKKLLQRQPLLRLPLISCIVIIHSPRSEASYIHPRPSTFPGYRTVPIDTTQLTKTYQNM